MIGNYYYIYTHIIDLIKWVSNNKELILCDTFQNLTCILLKFIFQLVNKIIPRTEYNTFFELINDRKINIHFIVVVNNLNNTVTIIY